MGSYVAPLTGHLDSSLGPKGKKKMAGKTKSVDGAEHPASDFAYVGDPDDTSTWHLPDFDEKHARLAVDMFSRTQGMSGKKKEEAKTRIAAAAKKHGIKTSFADFNNRWVAIFRAGDYGEKGKWTRGDLDEVVANFSAGEWAPPAVFGHPKEDSPAHGWVSELRRNGDVLEAKFTNVSDELEGSVKDMRFPNRSAAFYLDPKGKGPALRHVGFLGATPPEVKGLEPIQFSDGEFVAIEFDEEETMDRAELQKSIGEGIKNFFSELFSAGSDKHADTFTEAQVRERIAAAQKPLLEATEKLSKKFDELASGLATETRAAKDEAARGRARAFVEKMKAANKWVPAFSEAGLDKVLESLASSGASVKFGEAGKETEAMCFDQLCKFLEAQRTIVPTGAIAVKTRGGSTKMIKFNESRGVTLDQHSVLVSERAEEIVKEKKISFGEALKVARREMADAAADAGGIAAGAV